MSSYFLLEDGRTAVDVHKQVIRHLGNEMMQSMLIALFNFCQRT